MHYKNFFGFRSKEYSLIRVNRTLLLVIDIQKKLLNSIEDKENMIWNIGRLIDASKILNIKYLYTEQNPDKLGETTDYIKQKIGKSSIRKMRFSCAKEKIVLDFLAKNKIKDIILCGIETHVCIQQTAIELRKKGYRIFLPADAVSSRNNFDNKVSLKRLEKAGIIIGTTESIIFECCDTSAREEFRELSSLIKKKPEHSRYS